MFDIQRFADTLTSSFELVMPLILEYSEGSTSVEENKTIKFPNPRRNLTSAEVNAAINTLQQVDFFGFTNSEGQSVRVDIYERTASYTEEKQTVTLDLSE